MKALNAVIAVIVVPIMALNIFGGIASGIWLAVLGMWKPIFIGLMGLIGSSFLLSFALMPGILLILPASKLAEKNKYFLTGIFIFLGSLYTYSVIAIWCNAVMWVFVQRATSTGSLIALLLWSYGVAIGPLSYMASKEEDNEYSGCLVFFAAVSYIASAIWVFFGGPTTLQILILMGGILALGMFTMFAISMRVIWEEQRASRRSELPEPETPNFAQRPLLRPLEIVFLDDEPAVREAISMMLTQSFPGTEIVECQDGDTAWQKLSIKDPDIFITDFSHLGMKLPEMLRKLAKKNVSYPILVISGLLKDQALQKIKEEQSPSLSISLLRKPFSPTDLASAVTIALRK